MPNTKRRRLFRGAATAVALTLGGTALAACGSDEGDGEAGSGPVSLTYWTWTPGMDKVVDLWNKGPGKKDRITVTVKKQASGDTLVTKILTAHKAGKAPDLVQAEYQALPTLVSNDALADISGEVGGAKEKFAEGVWQQTTLGTDAVYAVPQDIGPMMFYYREDLFQQYGLKVPTTWEQFAETARALKKKAPDKDLTTFSANDSGLFAGLAQQAGAKWWTTQGEQWKVGINDPATQKVAEFWGGLVEEGAIDNQPMYTPAWNKALNTGKQIAWVSAVWAPGTLTTAAPDTKGKWAMAPLPQWSTGENVTGSWGGSSTAVTTDSKHKEAAAKFAASLNTDGEALNALGQGERHLPRLHRRPAQRRLHQVAGVLREPGRLLHQGRRDRADHRAVRLGPERERRLHRLQGRLRLRRQEQVGLHGRPGHHAGGDRRRPEEARACEVSE
ncbi:Substrate-binding transport OS=Streptomyces glaucescens OX=1907 GN=SGLAU_03350 PE=4 SV=1 [Streptomyces glaucescens]